jgi:hypothetical protein
MLHAVCALLSPDSNPLAASTKAVFRTSWQQASIPEGYQTHPEDENGDEPGGEDVHKHAVGPRLHIAEGQVVKVLQGRGRTKHALTERLSD